MMDRKEVVQNNAYQNFTAKVNLSQKAFQDRFQLDMGLFGSLQKNNYLTDEQKTFYSAALSPIIEIRKLVRGIRLRMPVRSPIRWLGWRYRMMSRMLTLIPT